MPIKMAEVYECVTCKSVLSIIFDPTDSKADVLESVIRRHQETKPDCASPTGFKLINQFVYGGSFTLQNK